MDVAFKLKGSTTIKAGNGTAPLNGKINAKFNLNKSTFDADLALDPTKAKLKALGFLPVDADLKFQSLGKTTGAISTSTGVLTADSKVNIQITSIKSFGLKLGGGSKCQTSKPSDIRLTSQGVFNPLQGGTVSSTYSIAKLEGCGLLNNLLSVFASGSGNKLTATLAP
ncbi:hypothetical protein [Aeromicrobium sp.]|uniref:hypothetical protein n=1 Tax=Aeromicrobium sp. TaxID=1871063 RepID=UPI0028B059DA|nr:hypothetical protein [Aeromicrobium sp.]